MYFLKFIAGFITLGTKYSYQWETNPLIQSQIKTKKEKLLCCRLNYAVFLYQEILLQEYYYNYMSVIIPITRQARLCWIPKFIL